MTGNSPAAVAVVGNPNSGKTTLFNALTGSRQRVGNWPGVTVDKIEGVVQLGGFQRFMAAPFVPDQAAGGHAPAESEGPPIRTADLPVTSARLVDLPGIYSLSATSQDEIVARNYILGGEAALVLNVIDAANLQRNLYLTSQLLEMKVPVMVVLTMMDLAERKGVSINVDHLSEHLGCPVVAVNPHRNSSIAEARRTLAEALSARRVSNARIDYPEEVEAVMENWLPELEPVARTVRADSRWVAIKLLEQDPWITDQVVRTGSLTLREITDGLQHVSHVLSEDTDVVMADYKFGFIHGLARHVMQQRMNRQSLTEKIDRIVLNRVLGIPIFFLAMYVVFWMTITVSNVFIDFFDILFGAVFVDGFSVVLQSLGSPGWLVAILAGGVGAGIQTVSTFIPVIFTMFLMLSLLEDSGYMARAAFVMDRFMRWVGLPGKSFVPMMVGFGCTVPAIVATRTLDSRKDRFMTIFMAPFMSCGARLPVYALFAAAFFPRQGGTVVFSIYVVGIVLAVLTGLLLKRTVFKGAASHFIMELPPYHAPRLPHIIGHTSNRLKVFVVRAGASIVTVVAVLGFLNSLGVDGSFGNEDSEKSILANVGKVITPVFAPMGIQRDNWPATVGIFSGVFAKEAVVGTLNSLYSQNDLAGGARTASVSGASLPAGSTRDESMPDGQTRFDLGSRVAAAFESIPAGAATVWHGLAAQSSTGVASATDTVVMRRMRESFVPAAAYAYMLFILIYTPCVAAMGTAFREMGKGYGLLLAGYLTVLAWVIATLYFQIRYAGSLLWIGTAAVVFAALVGVLLAIGRRTASAWEASA